MKQLTRPKGKKMKKRNGAKWQNMEKIMGPGPMGLGPMGLGPWGLGPMVPGPWAWAHGACGPMGQGPWAWPHGPGPWAHGARAHGPGPSAR